MQKQPDQQQELSDANGIEENAASGSQRLILGVVKGENLDGGYNLDGPSSHGDQMTPRNRKAWTRGSIRALLQSLGKAS